MPSFDPLAALKITAIEAVISGHVLRIPPLPAADWLPYLMDAHILGLLDLLEGDSVHDALDAGTTAEQLSATLEDMLTVATGRTPWAAFVLATAAREHWHTVGGELIRRGVRFEDISIAALLDAIYATMVARMDDKEIAKWHQLLDNPLSPNPQESTIRPPRGAKPLPAIAEQYVRVRPKTQLRRPQDRLGALSEQPTVPPAAHVDSDLAARSDF